MVIGFTELTVTVLSRGRTRGSVTGFQVHPRGKLPYSCHTVLSATRLTSPLQYDHRTWTIGSARTPSLSRLIHLHTWVGAQDLAKEADKSVEVWVEAIANLDSASESRQLHSAWFFFAPACTLGFSKSGSSLHLPKLTWNQRSKLLCFLLPPLP